MPIPKAVVPHTIFTALFHTDRVEGFGFRVKGLAFWVSIFTFMFQSATRVLQYPEDSSLKVNIVNTRPRFALTVRVANRSLFEELLAQSSEPSLLCATRRVVSKFCRGPKESSCANCPVKVSVPYGGVGGPDWCRRAGFDRSTVRRTQDTLANTRTCKQQLTRRGRD